MDETTATIRYGCSLARDLEENLENLANQPQLLYRSCDEIIRVFSYVKDRISYSSGVNVGVGHADQQPQQQLEVTAASGVPLVRPQPDILGSSTRGTAFGPGIEGKMKEIDDQHETAQVSMQLGEDVRPMEVSNASRGSSASQRQRRRRRDEGQKRREIVPVPRIGITDSPPEDGYTWRKYGQKDILNSRFPRSYFRCTHQKLYNCPAKKQVQRLDDDPDMFEVTYRGEHTCHLSSTAPSAPPPPSFQGRQDIVLQAPAAILHPHLPSGPSNSLPSTHWLSIDITRPPSGDRGTSSIAPGMQMYRDFSLATAGTTNTGAGPGPGPGSGPGPSSAAVTRFGDYQPVTDLADVMFNSGSSSNNSMDLIFSSMDDKWDYGEKKI